MTSVNTLESIINKPNNNNNSTESFTLAVSEELGVSCYKIKDSCLVLIYTKMGNFFNEENNGR